MLNRLIIDRQASCNKQELDQWILTLASPTNSASSSDSPSAASKPQGKGPQAATLLKSGSFDLHDISSVWRDKDQEKVREKEKNAVNIEDEDWKDMICDPPSDLIPFDITAFYSDDR